MLAAAVLAALLTRALVSPVLSMTEDLDHIQDNVPYKELVPLPKASTLTASSVRTMKRCGRSLLPMSAMS